MSVPVVLFAYDRTETLARTLGGLRAAGVRRLLAFSDGPRGPEQVPGVDRVRRLLRAIDWADVTLVERPGNLGLGLSIRTGVTEVLAREETVIVFEDDLVCAPAAYSFMCAALERYRDVPQVLSVTAWTHPRVTPRGVRGPYLDGRAECWTWGTWRRAWQGMERSALEHLHDAEARGTDPRRYGGDLVRMAHQEAERNLWAVRWSYLHIARGGLCVRPPHGLVDHVGHGPGATNAGGDARWSLPALGPPPAAPVEWPQPVEHPDCPRLWRRATEDPLHRLRTALGRLVPGRSGKGRA
jgi:hypothetical protein